MKAIDAVTSTLRRCLPLSTPLQKNKRAFTEDDVICLYDLFLKSGIHHITAFNVVAGRELMNLFLDSLQQMRVRACLTMDEHELTHNVVDIFEEMLFNSILEDHRKVREYVLEALSCNFLWIEASNELLEQKWYTHFINALYHLHSDSTFPIVIIDYLN